MVRSEDAIESHLLDTQILVRELLDNQAWADKVTDWYLLPFLGEIVAVVQRIRGLARVPASTAFCMVYQLLGSIEYLAISTATLTRMDGEETYERFRDDFPLKLRSQIRRLNNSRMQSANDVPTDVPGSPGPAGVDPFT